MKYRSQNTSESTTVGLLYDIWVQLNKLLRNLATIITSGDLVDNVTYAQAANRIALSSLVPGVKYFITDKNVMLVSIETNKFALEGHYKRGSKWNKIEYDFTNDHVQLEIDDKGNRIGCTFDYITYTILPGDPRAVFKWNNDLCLNNTVINGYFDCINSDSGCQIYGNTVKEGSIFTFDDDAEGNIINTSVENASEVTATGFDGEFNNCTFIGTTADFTDATCVLNYNTYDSCDLDYTISTSTFTNIDAKASLINTADTATMTNVNANSSNINISGTSSLNNSNVDQASDVTLEEASTFTNCLIKATLINSSGTSNASNTIFYGGTVTYDNSGNCSGSTIQIPRGASEPELLFNSSNPNVYINVAQSNKIETFTVNSNTIDFDASDENHFAGIVFINSNSTIDTISNLDNTSKRFEIRPGVGFTVSLAAATATNIVLPSGVATITLTGNNGDWVELEHDGANAYVIEINNF